MSILPRSAGPVTWVVHAVAIGLLGALAVWAALATFRRLNGALRWEIRLAPVLLHSALILPVLWGSMVALDPVFHRHGPFGDAVNAALVSVAAGFGFSWAYGRLARAAGVSTAKGWSLVLFEARGRRRFRVVSIGSRLVLGFVAYETLFVYLQMLADGWLARSALQRLPLRAVGALLWAGAGWLSCLAAMAVVRRLDRLAPARLFGVRPLDRPGARAANAAIRAEAA